VVPAVKSALAKNNIAAGSKLIAAKFSLLPNFADLL